MLWKKPHAKAPKANDLTAFIDEGSEIEGKYTFSGTVMLNGRFRGEIVSNDTLIVGEKGVGNPRLRRGGPGRPGGVPPPPRAGAPPGPGGAARGGPGATPRRSARRRPPPSTTP